MLVAAFLIFLDMLCHHDTAKSTVFQGIVFENLFPYVGNYAIISFQMPIFSILARKRGHVGKPKTKWPSSHARKIANGSRKFSIDDHSGNKTQDKNASCNDTERISGQSTASRSHRP